MKYSATSKILRRDGKEVASIIGWWDSQMKFEDLRFINETEKELWRTFHKMNNNINFLNEDLPISEGELLYQVIWKKI